MEWKDVPRRAYYEKYQREETEHDFGWYEAYRLPGNVYGIAEPKHFQEVNFFLIPGDGRALLLDTGMGIFSPMPLLKELYDGEIVAINSHFHFDHIGSNHLFEKVYGWKDAFADAVAKRGLKAEDMGDQMEAAMFKDGYPDGFDGKNFTIPPYVLEPVRDGQIFSLGNRELEVIHAPGHSADSIVLYDRKNEILFTGDTFYMGALYTHFDCPQFGRSDIAVYRDTLNRLYETVSKETVLYCSHNYFIAPASKLKEAADLMTKIINSSEKTSGSVNEGHRYLQKDSILKEEEGEGFSVIYAE